MPLNIPPSPKRLATSPIMPLNPPPHLQSVFPPLLPSDRLSKPISFESVSLGSLLRLKVLSKRGRRLCLCIKCPCPLPCVSSGDLYDFEMWQPLLMAIGLHGCSMVTSALKETALRHMLPVCLPQQCPLSSRGRVGLAFLPRGQVLSPTLLSDPALGTRSLWV